MQPSKVCLTRESAEPLYLQLSKAIEDGIRTGEYRAGQVLPSETRLCHDLGISRITVRQALDELIGKGLIVRRQGKGTFIAHPIIRSDPASANNLYDTLFAQKHAPTSKMLAFGLEPSPSEAAAAFGQATGTPLLRLDRLYLLNGRPVGLAFGWLRAELGRVDEAEAASHSTAYLIEHILGQRITKSGISIRAASAGRNVARELDVPERTPLLILTRRRLLADGRTADFSRIHMNGDSYEFSIDNLLAFESQPSLTLVAA